MSDNLDRLRTALGESYRLEGEIGRGGMATVYLATDRKHSRQVAFKVLRPEVALALGGDRFLREIDIASRLTHPHILPLYDSGEAAGHLYYAMPYVEGGSLRNRLQREKQLPIETALQICREVAGALGYAHSLGVVHRDIKPENILFEAGQAVITDFGIARAITEAGAGHLTETGFAVGTPAYMSPEQASGTGNVNGRSDVYSLGCVLYEMLAGEPPYTGPTAQVVMAKQWAEYGLMLSALGRYDEAVAALRRAQEFDPLAAVHSSDLATTLLRAGRYDESIREAARLIGLEPEFSLGHATLGWAHMMKGQQVDGLAGLAKAVALNPGNTMLQAQHGQALAMAGRRSEAREVLQQLEAISQERYVSPQPFRVRVHRSGRAGDCTRLA